MSEQDDIELENRLLRERVIECLYRLEKLERVEIGIEPGTSLSRLPQILSHADIDAAQEDISRRIKVLEDAVEGIG